MVLEQAAPPGWIILPVAAPAPGIFAWFLSARLVLQVRFPLPLASSIQFVGRALFSKPHDESVTQEVF